MAEGILHRRVGETPIAILDFETTGLNAGSDRVVEIGVTRIDPGEEPRLVMDTLINPGRRMGATKIHGIKGSDVKDAPIFPEVAGDLLDALADCVVCAYNVYFDMKFLSFELGNAGVNCELPPHFCLMYMRPLLKLGPRCCLEEACGALSVPIIDAHCAAQDTLASAELLKAYLVVMRERGLETFADIRRSSSYKFLDSFTSSPLSGAAALGFTPSRKFLSRTPAESQVVAPAAEAAPADDTKCKLRHYWQVLGSVISDLEITDEELEYVAQERQRLQLAPETLRALHTQAFATYASAFVDDYYLDDKERRRLQKLYRCLSQLGYAPGE